MKPSRPTALAAAAWPQGGLLRDVLIVLAGSALLAASARIQVPMWPVPMTMQTFAVLLIGATCGARLGALTVLAYLAQAAMGLPVLAGGRPFVLGGPTFGYLVGFVLAAGAVGWAVTRGWADRLPALLGVLLAGHALIYVAGVAWLRAAWMPDWSAALAAGLLPFLPGDALKVLLAAAAVRGLQRLRG